MPDSRRKILRPQGLKGNAGNRLALGGSQLSSQIISITKNSGDNSIIEDFSSSFDNQIAIDKINNQKWIKKLENERKWSSELEITITKLKIENKTIANERDDYRNKWIACLEKIKQYDVLIKNFNKVEDDSEPLIIHSVGVLKDNVINLRNHLEDKVPLVDIQLKPSGQPLVFGCEAKDRVDFKARCINPATMDGDIIFAIHIFGPDEKIKTFRLKKIVPESGFGKFQDFSFNMINPETEKTMPSGRYRFALMNRHFVNLRNKSDRQQSNVSDFVVRRRDIYFKFACQEEVEPEPLPVLEAVPPVDIPPTTVYQFKEGYELINVKRSQGLVHIPVERDENIDRFRFGWQANRNKDSANVGDQSGGYGEFKDTSNDTKITIRLEQIWKPEQFSTIDVNLREHEELGERRHCQIRIENDIEACEVGFEPAKPFVGKFKGGDEVVLNVVRSNTDTRMDVKWESMLKTQVLAALRKKNQCLDTAAVSINVREDRLFWNKQDGRVRFEAGQKNSFVRLKLPVSPELCMEEMHVEIHLEKYRGSSNEGVIIDKENDVRSFKILYDECKTSNSSSSSSSSSDSD